MSYACTTGAYLTHCWHVHCTMVQIWLMCLSSSNPHGSIKEWILGWNVPNLNVSKMDVNGVGFLNKDKWRASLSTSSCHLGFMVLGFLVEDCAIKYARYWRWWTWNACLASTNWQLPLPALKSFAQSIIHGALQALFRTPIKRTYSPKLSRKKLSLQCQLPLTDYLRNIHIITCTG